MGKNMPSTYCKFMCPGCNQEILTDVAVDRFSIKFIARLSGTPNTCCEYWGQWILNEEREMAQKFLDTFLERRLMFADYENPSSRIKPTGLLAKQLLLMNWSKLSPAHVSTKERTRLLNLLSDFVSSQKIFKSSFFRKGD